MGKKEFHLIINEINFHFRSNSMKFNSLKREQHRGYSVADVDTQNENDSASFSTSCNTMKNNYHKSCDTIDRNSGLNYYSLHSILSFVAESIARNKAHKTYKLHGKNSKKMKQASQQKRSKKLYKYNNSFNVYYCYDPVYFKMKFMKNKEKNYKYILVKNLPRINDFYHTDDTIDDPLQEFLKDHFELRNHLHSLFRRQTKKLLYIKDESDLPACILLNNILECFKFDFKSYNFNLNLNNYYKRNINNKDNQFSRKNLQDDILLSYINSFQLL